jgi:hypothetical protein
LLRSERALAASLPGAFAAKRQGSAERHLVKPTRQRIALADGGSFAGEDKNRGLKSIFRIVSIVQNPLTYTKDQSRVPPQQQLKRRFITIRKKALQQNAVRNAALHGIMAEPAKQQS